MQRRTKWYFSIYDKYASGLLRHFHVPFDSSSRNAENPTTVYPIQAHLFHVVASPEISFADSIKFSFVNREVREPALGPRFSKVLTSLKLLGDVTELEKMVKKGSINNLIVDKNFFHAN